MDEAVFISFFTSVDHVLGVVVWAVDLDWRFESRYGAQRAALPLLRRPCSLYWYAGYFEYACLEHVVEHLHSTNPTVAVIPAIDRRRHHRHRHPTGEGGEGAAGCRHGCLAAVLGRVLGVVTVKVEVDVPAPARRQAGTVVLFAGAVVVVVVVTGHVLVDVTGRGRLVVVLTGRVRVDVTGRVWVAVVTGCVVAEAVPAPATGGRLKRFTVSSTLTG